MYSQKPIGPFFSHATLASNSTFIICANSDNYSVFFCDVCVCAGAVRASSIFPILSVILLFMGGLCIAASEFYKSRHNIILSAGILFVSAGMKNILLLFFSLHFYP